MKKKITTVISLFAILLIGGCSSSEQVDGQEEINLTLTSGNAGSDINTYAFNDPWIEQVEEKTNVTIEAFYSEELVSFENELQSLKDGTVDIVAPSFPPYDTVTFPLNEVVMLPLANSDSSIAAKAYADLMTSDVVLQDGKTFYELEFEDNGLKALPHLPTVPYAIGVVDNEFKTVESLKNLELRTSGRTHEIFVSELDSSSVSLPVSEEYEALSRGVVDGTVKSVTTYEAYGIDEVVTDILSGANLGHFPLTVLMSNEKWDSLPENVQETMEETAYEIMEENTEILDKANEYEDKLKEEGMNYTDVSELDPEAQELISTASLNTWLDWIEAKEADGLPGKETAILWRDLIIKHGGEVLDEIEELE